MTNLRRYLVVTANGGESELYYCPKWYAIIQAAKYYGVAPWELLEQSIYWQDKAFIAMTAEQEARRILGRRNT